MKRSILTLAPILAFFLLTTLSCAKNESFTKIKDIEWQIYLEIKAHRINNGISPENQLVHQLMMGKEAQLFSAKLANSNSGLDTTGISVHWDNIHLLGGYNDLTLIQSTNSTSATDIVATWTSDSTTNAMILKDYTQCGVGVEYGSDNMAYVTVLMMKVDG
ncbi:MAG: hypothetical protein LC655_05010 [Bacteroidales bacterium]|nr:hypothetical protein [Bacteroidales bacterium]